MGFGWFLILFRVLRGKGDLGQLYRYTKKLIKENPLPTYLSIIIMVMSFFIINLNIKIHILVRELNELDNTPINECFIADPVIVPIPWENPIGDPITPPIPIEVMEKPVVPNIRRYAADKLNEISRSLDNEGG